MKRLQGGRVVDYDPFSATVEDVAPVASIRVPDGPISDVLAWVGDDPDRAAAALEAELGKDTPRSSLVDKLS